MVQFTGGLTFSTLLAELVLFAFSGRLCQNGFCLPSEKGPTLQGKSFLPSSIKKSTLQGKNLFPKEEIFSLQSESLL